MAEGKKSFIFYCDWKATFDELTDEQAGKLIKHLLSYVNDENPETSDPVTKIAFANMKTTLKRYLKKYEKYIEKQRVNGQKGGRPKKTQKTQPFFEKPKKADSVSVSDSEYTNVYNKKEFLSDWNELRIKYLKKPSHLNRLGSEEEQQLAEISSSYKPEEIRNALIGLFKQKKLPNDSTSMQSNPRHFLNYFESYLTAYHDRNEELYGKNEVA